MSIKEVKWELEAADQTKRATILLLAHHFRHEMTGPGGVPLHVFDRPFDYSRDDLMHFYEILENIRNQNTVAIENTKRSMLRMGMELPEFSIKHAKATGRGLEIWMCTIGAAIAPERRDDVRLIWKMLVDSTDHVPKALEGLEILERQTQEMTGTHGAMFSIGKPEWIELCSFVPFAFSNELQLR
jgi:hypothetical protein